MRIIDKEFYCVTYTDVEGTEDNAPLCVKVNAEGTEKMRFRLSEFDFNALDSLEFKEDSVREEIISPILWALGYTASGRNRIIRSKTLVHPYIHFGKEKRKVTEADYLIEINGKPVFVIEAKNPSVDIDSYDCISQAYSYAAHPEVQAGYFALCNGHKFSLYKTWKHKEVLRFDVCEIENYWDELCSYLLPQNLLAKDTSSYKPDFGMHLNYLGFHSCLLHFYGLRIDLIDRINPELFSFTTNLIYDGIEYCATFDFDLNALLFGLSDKLPAAAAWMATHYRLDINPLPIELGEDAFEVNIEAEIRGNIEKNNEETYFPLIVKRFF